MIKIGVAFATPANQVWYNVDVQKGATIREVIEISGILEQFPEINLENQEVGIFGKVVQLEALPREGDRIEIYRPITVDPSTVKRRKKAPRPKKKASS